LVKLFARINAPINKAMLPARIDSATETLPNLSIKTVIKRKENEDDKMVSKVLCRFFL
jgi:hypothetical protein